MSAVMEAIKDGRLIGQFRRGIAESKVENFSGRDVMLELLARSPEQNRAWWMQMGARFPAPSAPVTTDYQVHLARMEARPSPLDPQKLADFVKLVIPIPAGAEQAAALDHIAETVATVCDYSLPELRNEAKPRPLAEARMLYCYLARRLTEAPNRTISEVIARTHTSVVNCTTAMMERLAANPLLQGPVNAIEAALRGADKLKLGLQTKEAA